MSKYIYIPIEIKNREFLSKSLLSFFLAKKGYKVILGKSTEIDKMCLLGPKGVYLGTSIVQQHRNIFEKLLKRHHHVIAMDEEGLVYYNKENYMRNRVDKKTISLLDAFLIWGNHQNELVLSKCPQFDFKLKNIGNIRMEILKKRYWYLYMDEVKQIKERYGKFILFNTNFGAFNHYENIEKYIESVKKLVDAGKEDLEFVNDKIEHQEKVFLCFKNLAIKLKEQLPDYQIVIRPHPSENFDRWREELDGTGIKVVHEGTVVPWIIASECVVQQNCTTGIEALCLEKPVISYLPSYDKRFDDGLPNRMVPIIDNEKEMVDTIQDLIENKEVWGMILERKREEDLNNYINNLEDDKDIFEEYIKIFDEVAFENSDVERWRLWGGIQKIYESLSLFINKDKRKNIKYIKQKFSTLKMPELQQLLKISEKNLQIDLKSVQFKKVYNSLYLIYSEQKNEK